MIARQETHSIEDNSGPVGPAAEEVIMATQKPPPLEERVKRLEEALQHKMDKTDGEDLEERVVDLEDVGERVNDLEEKQEEIIEKTDDNESRVSDVENQAYDLEGWLARGENEHDDLSSRLNEHDSQISEHDSQISELESQGTDTEDNLS